MTFLQRSIRNSREAVRRWAYLWLAVMSLFLAAATVMASSERVTAILDYQMNAQTQGSSLAVLSDGSVEHTEWSCCPRVQWDVAEARLSPGEVQRLQGIARNSVRGRETVREVLADIGWMPEGALKVWPGNEARTIYSLRKQPRGEFIFYSELKVKTPATEELLHWIRGKVRVGPIR